MGGAIAVLSAQVDDMTRALENARNVAGTSEKKLEDLTQRADTLARRLELLMASMHDLPDRPAARDESDEDGRRVRFVRRRGGRDQEEAE
jgi:predicted  nucleic acid-binding Zn-ribbon protein